MTQPLLKSCQVCEVIIKTLGILVLIPCTVEAQVLAAASQSVPLTGLDSQATVIPAGSASTQLEFTVDPSTAGGDLFDVVTGTPES